MSSSEKETLDTKERILIAATSLFASKGFEGTSVRDIASAAQVNLASINYHFENKTGLYLSVFERNYHWLDSGIAALASEGNPSTKELACKIYDFFIENSHEFLNSFLVFLGGKNDLPAEAVVDCKGHFGPPGGEYLYQALRRDLPEITHEPPLRWAVATIFTQLVHASILMNCKGPKSQEVQIGGILNIISPHFRTRNIHALVESIEDFILKNPTYWDDLIS